MNTIIPWVGIIFTLILVVQGFIIPKSKIGFFLQSTWIIILTSFNSGGGDWIGNESYYWVTSIDTSKNVFSNIYPLLVNCFRSRGTSFITFNGVMSFIASLIIMFIIYRTAENKNLVMSFWTIFPVIDNVIQKRAYYGLALVVVAISIILNNKNHKFLRIVIFEMIIFIAMRIHSMYFLYFMVPFFLLLNDKWKKYISLMGITAGFILKSQIQTFVNLIMGPSAISKSELYFNKLASTATLSHTIFWAIWQLSQLLIIIYVNKYLSNNNRGSILLSLNWWGLLLIPLYSFNPVFTRVFRAIILFNYIDVADVLANKNSHNFKPYIALMSELLFALITFYMMDVNSNGLIQNVYPIFQDNYLLNIFNL